MEGTLEYANFRAWVPRNVLPVGTLNQQDWVYYDWGPRSFSEPLLCLHPIVGSAESFFYQVLSLAERGYRVIAPQLAVYWSAQEFCDGLHTFLDMLNIRRVHFYGAGIGGHLALQYAARRPERVASVALTHSFLSTSSVHHKIVFSTSVLRWLPEFLVRNAMRSLFPRGRAEITVAEAAEFSIMNTRTGSRDELASRLSLLVSKSTVVDRLRVPDNQITVIDVVEFTVDASAPRNEELNQAIPHARRALLKHGGDFPYLSCPDDVTMHLIVHMRRNAPPPSDPVSLPPPAKPRQPKFTHRASSSTSVLSDNDTETGDVEDNIRKMAEERVTSAENERLQRYSSDIARIRQFVREYDDSFLASVLEDCEGDADRAVDRIRDGQYKKKFHVKTRRRALRRAIKEVRAELGKAEPESGLPAIEEKNVQDPQRQGVLPTSPSTSPLDADSCLTSPGIAKADAGVGESAVSTPEVRNELTSSQKQDLNISRQSGGHSGVSGRDSMEIVDLSGNSGEHSAEKVSRHTQVASHSASEMSRSPRRRDSAPNAQTLFSQQKTHSPLSQRSRLSSRDPYPPETDSVAAYVTSAKVGMQSSDKLIGRGPAPFATSRLDDKRGKERSSLGRQDQFGVVNHSGGPRSSDGVKVQSALNEHPPEESYFGDFDSSIPKTINPSRSVADEGETTLALHQSAHDVHAGDGQNDASNSTSNNLTRGKSGAWPDAGAHKQYVAEDPWTSRAAHGPSTSLSIGDAQEQDEDSTRLREWMMSAQAASESVRRSPHES